MIQQLYSNNYPNSGNISAEFENLFRYLRAAEIAGRPLSELMGKLIDDGGNVVIIPVEMRFDPASGIEVKVGDGDWEQLAPTDTLRGPSGQNVGLIEGPLLYLRRDFDTTDGQTQVDYKFDPSGGDIMVFRNGALENPSAYTKDTVNGRVIFAAPLAGTQRVTIWTVRASSSTAYLRLDAVTVAPQIIFNAQYQDGDELTVYKNGLVQREGINADYTLNTQFGYISFNQAVPANTAVTMIRLRPDSVRRVIGLMLEQDYTHEDGTIRLDRIRITDGGIPVEKVGTVKNDIKRKANFHVGANAPATIYAGELNLWLDTSRAPNVLRFHDGVQWLLTSPDTSLPQVAEINARQYVRVNATGTGYELGEVDLSGYIPRTWRGASNGLAPLNSDGQIPSSYIPALWVPTYLAREAVGTVANGNLFLTRVFRNKLRIDGLSARLSAGTCTIQIAVDGVAVTPALAVSTSGGDHVLTQVIEIDGTTSAKKLEVIVGSVATASNLQIGFTATMQGAS